MFDIAPSEFLLVAVVALLVIGPKDLPKAMRVVGNWVGKARGMARHFRAGLDTMMREAELEEMEKKWQEENARIMATYAAREPSSRLLAPEGYVPPTVDTEPSAPDAPDASASSDVVTPPPATTPEKPA